MVSIHCFIHRQALVSKTLPQKLLQTLDSAIRIVNYIKSSALNSRLFTLLCEDLDSDHKNLLYHTEVRWLSKGNMLARLYELKEEVILFLQFKEKHDLLTMFKDDSFQWVHSKASTLLNVISFSRLFEAIKNNKLDANLKPDIKPHLQALEDEFRRYYRDIDSESPIWHMTRNPFVVDVLQLPEEVQEEFLEKKADSSMKNDFHLLTFEKFWIKRLPVNSKLACLALRVLIPFSSTYLCEKAFRL
ncbi:unnamed protein product [Parnassius apollo]|uniref:(apollo) hypothetical protein n=1 Tax=Parnassius apollo TaxID=110799 RepID=A0A8S3WQK6_PARAO|nr:unnamed protein product [Parnassius apollo]